MRIAEDIARKLALELTSARPSERSVIICRYQELTGKSRDAIYRLARKHGWSSGKKKRRDAGKSVLSKEQVLEVAKMIKKTQRNGKTMIMPATVAKRTMDDSGKLPKTSVGTVNRQLKLHKVSKRDMAAPAPYVRMRSKYSNHVHQFDTSNCVQYFFADDNSGLIERDMTQFYKNKVDNFKKIKRKLYRYVLTEHKSGLFIVQYYYATGENTKDQLDFFYQAWRRKDHPHKFPFCGVPDILVTDKGSALTSQVSQNLLDRLDIRLITHAVKNSRAKGSVENMHWVWEQQYESLLRERPVPNLESMNLWSYDLCVYLNATMIHSRYNDTRNSMWLKCVEKALRLPPEYEIFTELALSDPDTRKVSGALTI